MEITGSGFIDINALMESTLAELYNRGLVLDGVLSSSEKQAKNLWPFEKP
ncbi:hypothetical protein FHS20_004010 [Phyllobacterium endophyticum]|nr:hypothetical protein [Phyllobacterium endophyticum]